MFVPNLLVGAWSNGNPYDVVLDNSATGNQLLYEGTAHPGTASSAGTAKWRIRKFFYDSNSDLQGWRWADSTTEFTKDWSLRATYTYTAY